MIFHNGVNYDYRFIVKGKTTEKYKTILRSNDNLKNLKTFRLSNLVDDLTEGIHKNYKQTWT